jgi:streptomycin 6-kinase
VDRPQLPHAVADLQRRANGDEGAAWVDRFPLLVEEAVDRFALREIGAPFPAAQVAFVAPVRLGDGADAVLKLSYQDAETRHEVDALHAWGGRKAVRLLDADTDLGALLLERVVPGDRLVDHPDRAEAVTIACQLLRSVWQAPRADHPFTRVTDLVAAWSLELPARWAALDAPSDEALLDAALRGCVTLAQSERAEIIANRDYHRGNILRSDRAGWLVIDPTPLVGEPAFDAGWLVVTELSAAPGRAAAETLIATVAAALGQDPERVRQWAYLRAFETLVWSQETGLADADGARARCRALLT